MADTAQKEPTARPLSPHLSIYRPTMTMAMSIAHRITGAKLYFGAALMVWWLLALASGPAAFAWAAWFFGSPLGFLVLFALSWALMHHLLGGVRHFVWDLGYGFDAPMRDRLATGTAVGGFVLTALVWALALALG
ncbi:MAG: succinate dehydrogenase, cytochrome b556 subunit [Hyphomicrobiales bacterium]|nr:succinate dehydrogenase, cytochrome b556 subunit [Hyphomicrobiales bacterium]